MSIPKQILDGVFGSIFDDIFGSDQAELAPKAMGRKRSTAAEMDAWRDVLMQITNEIKPATVRQVFYQCVVRDLIEKTEKGYKRVAATLAELRKTGRMPYGWLADATRWQRRPRSHDSLTEAIRATAQFYRRDALTRSQRYVEVWLEKEALAGVVVQATEHFDVPLMTARGFASLSFLHSSAETIKSESRPTTIYHLGDYDPSGQQAARSIRDALFDMSGREDLEFVQLAVLPEQIDEFNLPTRPTKREGNTHAKHWRGDSVELDAIHPKVLKGMVGAALYSHIPQAELQAIRAAEESERSALQMFYREIDQYRDDQQTIVLERLSKRMAENRI